MKSNHKCSVPGCTGEGVFMDHVHKPVFPDTNISKLPSIVRQLKASPYWMELAVLYYAAGSRTGGLLLEEILFNHPKYFPANIFDMQTAIDDKSFCGWCLDNWDVDPHQLDAFMQKGSHSILDIKAICLACEQRFRAINLALEGAAHVGML